MWLVFVVVVRIGFTDPYPDALFFADTDTNLLSVLVSSEVSMMIFFSFSLQLDMSFLFPNFCTATHEFYLV